MVTSSVVMELKCMRKLKKNLYCFEKSRTGSLARNRAIVPHLIYFSYSEFEFSSFQIGIRADGECDGTNAATKIDKGELRELEYPNESSPRIARCMGDS